MKAVIIKSSELGMNCWLPIRFFGKCWKCSRYLYCKYPERVKSEAYERLLENVKRTKKELEIFVSQ